MFLHGLVVVGTMLCALVFQSFYTPESPRTHLVGYVKHQMYENTDNVSSIEHLPFDSIDSFAGTTCIRAPTAEAARVAALAQLEGLPRDVREDIVRRAIIDGVSMKSSAVSSKTDPRNAASTTLLFSYHSTIFDPDYGYETCILASGVNVVRSDVISGYSTTKTQTVIGHEPCRCGFVWCVQCPIVEERTVETPLLSTRALSAAQIKELQSFMVHSAIKQVSLVHTEESKWAALTASHDPSPPWQLIGLEPSAPVVK